MRPPSPVTRGGIQQVADRWTTDISISVVSHSQIDLVSDLLTGLKAYCSALRFELILTLNLAETLPFTLESFPFPIRLIENPSPLGFGANQNQAFTQASGRYFCVINPDIQLECNPFAPLLACIEHSGAGVIAPAVVGEDGALEDSARRFPTPWMILRKFFGAVLAHDYVIRDSLVYPDWVAGMFMMFPRELFERLEGFDERYFLYYEDVDICARLRRLGYAAVVCPQARVVHRAQRHSHRNFRYLRWHLQSMLRFFLSDAWRRIRHGPLKKPGVGRAGDNEPGQ
ncbi:MAG: glycosyltransferase [Rhodoferax sp.]